MKMTIPAELPPEPFNNHIRKRSIEDIMKSIVEDLIKAELSDVASRRCANRGCTK